jgi:hypothetical protein
MSGQTLRAGNTAGDLLACLRGSESAPGRTCFSSYLPESQLDLLIPNIILIHFTYFGKHPIVCADHRLSQGFTSRPAPFRQRATAPFASFSYFHTRRQREAFAP